MSCPLFFWIVKNVSKEFIQEKAGSSIKVPLNENIFDKNKRVMNIWQILNSGLIKK